jgi:protein-S-isoprenylcysteine O-methyltransferase Ste14
MTCEPAETARQKQATRRYMRDMAVAGALYVGFVFTAAFVVRNLDPPQWANIVLALVPLAPALLMLRAYLVHLNSMDEFQRRMQTDALLVSTGIFVFGSFAYGFLEEWAGLPHLGTLWIFPIFTLVFSAVHIVIRLRNK